MLFNFLRFELELQLKKKGRIIQMAWSLAHPYVLYYLLNVCKQKICINAISFLLSHS